MATYNGLNYQAAPVAEQLHKRTQELAVFGSFAPFAPPTNVRNTRFEMGALMSEYSINVGANLYHPYPEIATYMCDLVSLMLSNAYQFFANTSPTMPSANQVKQYTAAALERTVLHLIEAPLPPKMADDNKLIACLLFWQMILRK